MLLNCGVLEKTFESPLDCKEVQPVHPKGNQSWIFIGRTDVEAETPILWPPDVKSQLFGKDADAGKDWNQEKRTTEDEMVGWHHRLDGHEFDMSLDRSWWWTGKPGVLQSTGSQRVGHNWSDLAAAATTAFIIVHLSHPYITTGKTRALIRRTFVSKVMSLLFNMLFWLVIAFLPRSKRLLISWLQSPSANDFGAQEDKVFHCFHCSPIYLPWSDGTRCRDLSFLNVVF